MRFTVAAAAAGQPSVLDAAGAFEAFEELLRRCERACHELIIEELERLRASGLWAHLRERDQGRLEVLSQAALAESWAPPRRIVAPAAQLTITVEGDVVRALRAANKPVSVFVESALRDGALLDGILRVLGAEPLRELLSNPPTPHVVQMEHCGGFGDIPQRARAAADQLNAAGLPIRMVAVFDSDAREPATSAANIEATANRVRDLVPECHVHVHNQVSVENYIPDVFWVELHNAEHPKSGMAKALDELLEMRSEGRASLKFGADNKLKKQALGDGDERPFYAALAGKRLAALTDEEREAWAHSLRTRDTYGDLQALVALIDSLR
jgi:hypothetical protein